VIGDNLGQYAFCVKENPNGGYIITGKKAVSTIEVSLKKIPP
jgi:hypothetical protein